MVLRGENLLDFGFNLYKMKFCAVLTNNCGYFVAKLSQLITMVSTV